MDTAVVKPADTVPSKGDKGEAARREVKFEVFGEEMIEKRVKPSGNSGRVYLPPDWAGCRVKVIRIGRD
jgi:putative transposon-encoded protein